MMESLIRPKESLKECLFGRMDARINTPEDLLRLGRGRLSSHWAENVLSSGTGALTFAEPPAAGRLRGSARNLEFSQHNRIAIREGYLSYSEQRSRPGLFRCAQGVNSLEEMWITCGYWSRAGYRGIGGTIIGPKEEGFPCTNLDIAFVRSRLTRRLRFMTPPDACYGETPVAPLVAGDRNTSTSSPSLLRYASSSVLRILPSLFNPACAVAFTSLDLTATRRREFEK
jgi:hypothetical protein